MERTKIVDRKELIEVLERYRSMQLMIVNRKYCCPHCGMPTPKRSNYCCNCGQKVTLEKPAMAVLD